MTTSLALSQAKYVETVTNDNVFYYLNVGDPQTFTSGSAVAFTPRKGWWGFVLRGGQGGRHFLNSGSGDDDNGSGGAGGVVRGMRYFDGSTTIYVWVGQHGGSPGGYIRGSANQNFQGGRSGGGNGWIGGGDGGGASMITTTPSPPSSYASRSDIIAIAGGGGGGGAYNDVDDRPGGNAGSITSPNNGAETFGPGHCGGRGRDNPPQTGHWNYAGGGGGATQGGNGGNGWGGCNGTFLQGGNGEQWGGGGGGGLYGGGAGCGSGYDDGGGGGSSYTNATVYALPEGSVHQYGEIANFFANLGYSSSHRRTSKTDMQDGVVCMVYMGMNPAEYVAFP
ncbi:MAG: glycine-rich protein [Oscillospiraceae bacterium]|nr:glycine-rich protein [Oscillospiraceae bacterium]